MWCLEKWDTTLLSLYRNYGRTIQKRNCMVVCRAGIRERFMRNDDLLEKYADINFATAFNYADLSALKAIESGEI